MAYLQSYFVLTAHWSNYAVALQVLNCLVGPVGVPLEFLQKLLHMQFLLFAVPCSSHKVNVNKSWKGNHKKCAVYESKSSNISIQFIVIESTN